MDRNGELQPHDPGRLRISDDDRHRVAEVLRTAAGEGRIDLEELDERLEATYAAKTYAELVPITADLPAHQAQQAPTPRRMPAVPGPTYQTSFAVMSETKRLGSWTVEENHSAFCLMGSVVLDLREASFTTREVTIAANAVMGEVRIIVNADTVVRLEGVPVMGEFVEQRPRVEHQPRPDSPVVRIKGLALMGSVKVQRKARPGESRRRLTGGR